MALMHGAILYTVNLAVLLFITTVLYCTLLIKRIEWPDEPSYSCIVYFCRSYMLWRRIYVHDTLRMYTYPSLTMK